MAREYSASVVGGGMGGRLSLRALTVSDRYRPIAAADLRPDVREALEKEFPGLQTFASAGEMFAACPTDIVCVSTYPSSHLEVTLEALKLPLKGMLVEKPLADASAAGRQILEAIRARKLPMAVPHGLMAAPHALRILKHIHDGDIGRLVLMEIECIGWDIINAGIHWLDFFVTAARGDAMEYVLAGGDATTRTWRDGMQVETEAVTCVHTRNGVRALMHTGDEVRIASQGNSTLFRIVGEKGMIEFPGWKSEYKILNAAHPHNETIHVDPGPRRPHQIHLDNLAAQMDARQTDYTIPTDSLTALELCEAAYLSHRHRCKVTLPLTAFIPPAPVEWSPGQPYSGHGGGRDGRQFG